MFSIMVAVDQPADQLLTICASGTSSIPDVRLLFGRHEATSFMEAAITNFTDSVVLLVICVILLI